MEQVKRVLDASVVWRWLDALCVWVGRQWDRSAPFLKFAKEGRKITCEEMDHMIWWD